MAGRRRKHEHISPDFETAISIRRDLSLPTGAEGAALRTELHLPTLPGSFLETEARKTIKLHPRVIVVASKHTSQNILIRGIDWISSWFAHSEDPFATKSRETISPRPWKRLRLSPPEHEPEIAPPAKIESGKEIELSNSRARIESPTALSETLPTFHGHSVKQRHDSLPKSSRGTVNEVLETSNVSNLDQLLAEVACDSPCIKYAKRAHQKKSTHKSTKTGRGSIAYTEKGIDVFKATKNSRILKTQTKDKRLKSSRSAALQSSLPEQWFELNAPGEKTSITRERYRAIKTIQSKLRILYPKMSHKELKHLTLDEMIDSFRRPGEEESEALSCQRIRQGNRPMKELFWIEAEAAFECLAQDDGQHLAQGEVSEPTKEELENDLNEEESAPPANATSGLDFVPMLSNRIATPNAPIFESPKNPTPQAPVTAPTIDNDLSTLEDAPPAAPVRQVAFAGETTAFVPHTPEHQGVWPTDIKRYLFTSLAGARSYPTDKPSFALAREFVNCNSPLQDSPDTPPRKDVPGMVPNNAYSPASPSKKQNEAGPQEKDAKVRGNEESPTRHIDYLGNEMAKLQMFDLRSGQIETEKQAREAAAAEIIRKAEAKRQAALKAEQEAQERERLEELRKTRIIHKLSDNWKSKVDETMAVKNPARKVAGELSRKDFGTLLPQTRLEGIGWLNDEIVNEFLDLAVKKKLDETGWTKTSGTAPKVHAFNTHLYSTFKSKGYNGVRRWAMRAKLGGKRLLDTEEILIPINDCAHWTLLVISGKDRTIRYYDSLGGEPKKYTDFALQYLAKELGNDFKESEWKVEKSWSQQQNNSNDCGVFVCMNGLALITGKAPSRAFQTKDMPLAREMVAGILLGMEL